MFVKNSKIMVIFVLALIIPLGNVVLNANDSTSVYDNTEFETELTSEEQTAADLKAKKEDYQTYISLRENITFVQFSQVNGFKDEQAFHDYEEGLYTEMRDDTSVTQENKDSYYIAMIGDPTTDGLTDIIYDFTNKLKAYGEDEKIYDVRGALTILNAVQRPDVNISNLQYIAETKELITELDQAITIADKSTLSEEELAKINNANILFSNQLNGLMENMKIYSLPQKSLLSRLTNTQVVFNIALLIGGLVLLAVRFPIIKKQQEYAWGQFRAVSLISIPVVTGIFYILFYVLFQPLAAVDEMDYSLAVSGVPVNAQDRVMINQQQTQTLYIYTNGSDNIVTATSIDIVVTNDPNRVASKSTELPEYTISSEYSTKFSVETSNEYVIPVNEDDEYAYVTYSAILKAIGFSATDDYEPNEDLEIGTINQYRNTFFLKFKYVLIIPALFFGILFFCFILMPDQMVKMYLNELYTINKFCGFLSYNMAYRNNARILIEESLHSIDSGKFAEDFAIIFFEKDRKMIDKINDISQIYSFKFFEMYLGIVNIIFDEGVSESTLKSLGIIQQFGDEYYNQADLFFKSKKAARGQLLMIIIICMLIPIMVKFQVSSMLSLYITTGAGYNFTIGVYIAWFGLICLIFNMYKDNKIVRKEGRYV